LKCCLRQFYSVSEVRSFNRTIRGYCPLITPRGKEKDKRMKRKDY